MKPTVSGTDDQGHPHVSQTSTSSKAKIDVCPVTTPKRHFTYTIAQLHEITVNCLSGFKSGKTQFNYIPVLNLLRVVDIRWPLLYRYSISNTCSGFLDFLTNLK